MVSFTFICLFLRILVELNLFLFFLLLFFCKFHYLFCFFFRMCYSKKVFFFSLHFLPFSCCFVCVKHFFLPSVRLFVRLQGFKQFFRSNFFLFKQILANFVFGVWFYSRKAFYCSIDVIFGLLFHFAQK